MASRGTISSADTLPKGDLSTHVREGREGRVPSIGSRATLFVSLAHTLCDAGRTLEAEELCRFLLYENPRLPTAQAALGRALFESGQLHEARAVLERLAAEQPGLFVAYRFLAEVLVQAGGWHRASEVLLQAETLSPGQPRIAQLIQMVNGVTPIEELPDEGAGAWPAPARGFSPAGRPRTWEGLSPVDAHATPAARLLSLARLRERARGLRFKAR